MKGTSWSASIFVVSICFFVGVTAPGGWRLFKRNVWRGSCYSHGFSVRTYVRQYHAGRCVTFCQRFRLRFCEYDFRSGYCRAAHSCYRLMNTPGRRIVNIYVHLGNFRSPILRRPYVSKTSNRWHRIISYLKKPIHPTNPKRESKLTKLPEEKGPHEVLEDKKELVEERPDVIQRETRNPLTETTNEPTIGFKVTTAKEGVAPEVTTEIPNVTSKEATQNPQVTPKVTTKELDAVPKVTTAKLDLVSEVTTANSDIVPEVTSPESDVVSEEKPNDGNETEEMVNRIVSIDEADVTTTEKPVVRSNGRPVQTKDPTRPLTMKIGVIVASDLAESFYDLYGISKLPNKEELLKGMVLINKLKGLNNIFSNPSIGDINLKVFVTHISVVPEETWRQWTDLRDFCRSEHQTTLVEADDAVIYMVKSGGESSKSIKLPSAGLSITTGICRRESRCAVVKEVGVLNTASGRLAAHELGHILGLIDDGRILVNKLRKSSMAAQKAKAGEYPYDDMRCKDEDIRSIMAGSGDVWSSCSRDRLKLIFGSDSVPCLDIPPKHDDLLLPDASVLFGNFQNFTREEMCTILNEQDPSTASWKLVYMKPNNATECSFEVNECSAQAPTGGLYAPRKLFDGVQFVMGAKCSTGFCYIGECLSADEIDEKLRKLVDG